jgi:hypothetical protein
LVVPHVVPCVGVLMGLAADDPESQARLAAFAQGLQQSGWSISQNLWIDYRWGGGDPEICANTQRIWSRSLPTLFWLTPAPTAGSCAEPGLAVTSSKAGCDRPGQVRRVHNFSQTHAVWLISYSVPRRLVAYCLPHHHAGRVTRTGPSASSTNFNRNFLCSRIRGRPWPENR